MPSIKGHFNGTAVVLDEPASLAVGQRVRVIVESDAGSDWSASHVGSCGAVPPDFVRRPGSAAGQFTIADDF